MTSIFTQLHKVLRFSLEQHVKGKGYRTGILIGFFLLFLIPIGIFALAANIEKSDAEEEEAAFAERMEWAEEADPVPLKQIVVVDQTEGEADYSVFSMVGMDPFQNLSYVMAGSLEEAQEAAQDEPGTAILLVEKEEDSPYLVSVLLPQTSRLTYEEVTNFEEFIGQFFMAIQIQKASLTEEQQKGLARAAIDRVMDQMKDPDTYAQMEIIEEELSGTPGAADSSRAAEEQAAMADTSDPEGAAVTPDPSAMTDPSAQMAVSDMELPEASGEINLPVDVVKDVLSIAIPYLVILILYFMILFYGQGICNLVILEKTSKLVDTVLICLKPPAMIFGKTLALCLAAVVQLACWLAGLALGLAAGIQVCRAIHPPLADKVEMILSLLKSASGVFTLPGILMALLIIFAGFLMYGMLAAFGASMASKPEDLSHTNMLFTMALVISFMLSLSGSLNGHVDGSMWQVYMPFTAMLVAPGAVLLGQITIGQACLSLLLILATTVLLSFLAGRTYQSLIYYRGKVLSPIKILKSMFSKS